MKKIRTLLVAVIEKQYMNIHKTRLVFVPYAIKIANSHLYHEVASGFPVIPYIKCDSGTIIMQLRLKRRSAVLSE